MLSLEYPAARVPQASRPQSARAIGLSRGSPEWLPVSSLRSNPRNARRHSPKQIEQIAASIRQFGFMGVIVIDEKRTVLAGHGRLAAAQLIGLPSVPCVVASHLSPEAQRAFMLADNRLAEHATWDDQMLKIELEELSAQELDFDLEITGFDTVDLDRLLCAEPSPVEQGEADHPDDDLPDLAADSGDPAGRYVGYGCPSPVLWRCARSGGA